MTLTKNNSVPEDRSWTWPEVFVILK